jgi:hemerythrin family non-heme iron protein
MGFDIPEPFCWDDSFQVFYDAIDEEHKGLFKGIFDVAAAPADAAKLTHLVDLVKKHFSTEEAMMTAKNYDGYANHKQVHDEFVAKLGTLSAPVSPDTVKFAKEWLVNHIKGTDMLYKGKL